jgi:hypothetical protein
MKLKCRLCDKLFLDSEFLSAPSPFDPEDTLYACPQCKQVTEGFDHLCDVEGCKKLAGCGFPLPEKYQKIFNKDYLHSCHEHWKLYEK